MRTDASSSRNGLHFHDGSTCHGTATLSAALKQAKEYNEDLLIFERTDAYESGKSVTCYSLIRPFARAHASKKSQLVAEYRLIPQIISYNGFDGPKSDSGILVNFKALHYLSKDHRPAVEAAKKCGCFYCLGIFNSMKIDKWTDSPRRGEQGVTAICPLCNIDAVLPDGVFGFKITKTLLQRMNKIYFQVEVG